MVIQERGKVGRRGKERGRVKDKRWRKEECDGVKKGKK